MVSSEMDYKKIIGERLRDARQEKGYTLAEVSKLTHGMLSPSRLGNYELGKRLLKPQEAKILASVLDAKAAHLMCLEGEEMTVTEYELITNFRILNKLEQGNYSKRIAARAVLAKLEGEPETPKKKPRKPLK